jgi:hypothetical protein
VDLFFSLPKRQAFFLAIRPCASKTVPRATQRMPPVNTPMSRRHGAQVVQMAVFLPQFVGKKKRDDEQRND